MSTPLNNPHFHAHPAAAACDVLVVGQFPPPVHGFAQATADVAALLEARGLRVQRIDLKPVTGPTGLLAILRLRLGQMTQVRKATCQGAHMYLALSGGVRQAVDLSFLVLARVAGARISIHHHSFAYLDRASILTRLCFLVAGSSATHIALCSSMKSTLQRRYRIARTVEVISNASLPSIHSQARGRSEVQCIGYLSALTRQKGILEFLRVAMQLAERHPDLRFAIAGPCHDVSIREAVQGACTKYPGIRYHGPVYDDAKTVFLESIDVLLFPTSYRNEAEPLVIWEAAASGIPVIAWQRGCIGEMLATADAEPAAIPQGISFVANAAQKIEGWIASPESFRRHSAYMRVQFERVAAQATQTFNRVFLGQEEETIPRQNAGLRLLHVIQTVNPESGGPIEALLRISEVLARRGHSVEVLSLDAPQDMARFAMPFPATGVGPGLPKYGYTPRLTAWLRGHLHRFDVVILHGLWDYSPFGAWRALRKSHTPYFIFAHGMLDPWFRDQFPLKHLAKQVYWLFATGRVLRDAETVLFTCEEERMRSKRMFRGYSYNDAVVLFGTADATGDPQAERAALDAGLPVIRGRNFLLYMGRIHPKKGCDLLIEAFADTAARTTDLDLVIAGPDQVGWVPALKALAEERGVSERIHWTGMLMGDMKWGALRSAEALILPSHQENFGIVVAEAMACSTPVLVSDKVNIWREIQSAHAGIVEPDDLAGTCRLITRFLALDQNQRAQMGAAARRKFLESFDVEAATHDLLRVIGPALAHR